MREQSPVKPVVSQQQFLRRHLLWLRNHVRGVIEIPVSVQQTALGFHLPEKWGARIWRQDMERRAFHAVLFDPIRQARKRLFGISIEPYDKTPVHLDTVIAQN